MSSMSSSSLSLFSPVPLFLAVYLTAPRFLPPSKHSVSPRINYSTNKRPVQTEDFPVAHLAAAASAVVGGGVRPVAAAAALQDAADVAVVVAADPAAPAGAPE